MVPLKRVATVTAALLALAALVATSSAWHEHPLGSQDADQTNCDACHLRQLSVVETDSPPAPSAPDLVAHGVPSVRPRAGRDAGIDIQPTRGPPA